MLTPLPNFFQISDYRSDHVRTIVIDQVSLINLEHPESESGSESEDIFDRIDNK